MRTLLRLAILAALSALLSACSGLAANERSSSEQSSGPASSIPKQTALPEAIEVATRRTCLEAFGHQRAKPELFHWAVNPDNGHWQVQLINGEWSAPLPNVKLRTQDQVIQSCIVVLDESGTNALSIRDY